MKKGYPYGSHYPSPVWISNSFAYSSKYSVGIVKVQCSFFNKEEFFSIFIGEEFFLANFSSGLGGTIGSVIRAAVNIEEENAALESGNKLDSKEDQRIGNIFFPSLPYGIRLTKKLKT